MFVEFCVSGLVQAFRGLGAYLEGDTPFFGGEGVEGGLEVAELWVLNLTHPGFGYGTQPNPKPFNPTPQAPKLVARDCHCRRPRNAPKRVR